MKAIKEAGQIDYDFVGDIDASDQLDVIGAMSAEDAILAAERWDDQFHLKAHKGQLPPEGDWSVWLVLGGRGFGKTRAGSEWVNAVARSNPFARIALVGASLGEVRSVMVEGESGLIGCCPEDSKPRFEPSLQRLKWPNGAQAFLYSASEPESLRGPQHSHAWCDEVGKWPTSHGRASQAWDNLLLGMRLGPEQRVVATTTPRNVPLVRRILESDGTTVTGGPSRANSANLPASFLQAMDREFGGSQLARQELAGEMILDHEGALWRRCLLEKCREPGPDLELRRVVVAVDPPASAHGDECGIIVAGLDMNGLASVLADCSIGSASPEHWARTVANAAREWNADRIVAEANQGGAMVESVLRAADHALPVKLVHASRGKTARAEPVAALYEAGRVRHMSMFAKLEDQLCGMMVGGEYLGPGRSPDRADALVWALSELMLGNSSAPRVMTV